MESDNYAIVVGINHYYHKSVPPLNGAVKDATLFAEWVTSPDGGNVPLKNLELILSTQFKEPENDFDASPLKHHVDRAFEKFGVGQKRRVGSRLYFYFAGHGLGPRFDDVALLMANAARHRLNCNIGVGSYRSSLREAAPFDHMIFFLDCCRDFTEHAMGQGPAFSQGRQPRAQIAKDFIVMGASYGQRSFEPPAPVTHEKRGLLTRALLEGLGDKKAIDGRGRITAASLKAYLERRVPELATEAGLRQTQEPEILSTQDDLEFGRTALIPKIHLRITTDREIGGEVILRAGDFSEIDRRSVAETPWEVEVAHPGFYVAEHSLSDREIIIDTRKLKVTGAPYDYELR
jgi:uncharacterized caspase-like protein